MSRGVGGWGFGLPIFFRLVTGLSGLGRSSSGTLKVSMEGEREGRGLKRREEGRNDAERGKSGEEQRRTTKNFFEK